MPHKPILYHNGVCSKSNGALEMLIKHNIPHEVRWYMEDPLSRAELERLIGLLQMKPAQIIRKNEEAYQQHYEGKELNDGQWLDALVQYPILMQRPIVEWKGKAIIARPGELALDFVKSI